MNKTFFTCASIAIDNITNTFTFVHPLRLSMLRFSKEIKSCVNQGMNNADINNYLGESKRLIHGLNYGAIANYTLDDINNNLAVVLLSHLFSIYEGFCKEILEELGITVGLNEDSFKKTVTSISANSEPISFINRNLSSIMDNEIVPQICTSKYYNPSRINYYLLCCKFFKEARNSYIHNNSITGQRLIDAYNAFLPYNNITSLGIKTLDITTPILGHAINITIESVIGFSNILMKLIATWDLELARTTFAESLMLAAIKNTKICKSIIGNRLTISHPKKRDFIRRMFKQGIGFPVVSTVRIDNYLITNRIFIR